MNGVETQQGAARNVRAAPLQLSLFQRQSDHPVGLVNQEEREIQEVAVFVQVCEGKAQAELCLVGERLRIFPQARAAHVVFGFHFDGDEIIFPLQDEIHFVGRVQPRPIARLNFELARERFQHEIFRQCAFEFAKQAIPFREDGGREMGQAAQEADVGGVDLECAHVIVSGERQAGRGDARHFVDELGVHEPLQGVLVFAGAGAFLDNVVEEALVLSGKLRGQGIPDERELRIRRRVRMLREIAFVGFQDVLERPLDKAYIMELRPVAHGLGHAARHVIHLELLDERLEKSGGDGREAVDLGEICCEVFFAARQQEFRERQRAHLQKVHLADGERGRACQSDAEQGTGTGDVIFRGVLMEILERIQRIRRFLDFIENDERVPRRHRLRAGHRQVRQDPPYIFGMGEEILVLWRFLEIEIRHMFVFRSAEFLQQPRLANLPQAFQDQRLAYRRGFPCPQAVEQQAFYWCHLT